MSAAREPPAAGPLFRASGQSGFAAAILNDPRHVSARKLEREVQVQFAASPVTVQTPEGDVQGRAGDAIVTGSAGERWPVGRSRFDRQYRPVPPTQAGTAGRYVSVPGRVMAVPMTQRFEVLLEDAVSRLRGQAGDWLVDYGDGSLGIVSRAIFADTYEILG